MEVFKGYGISNGKAPLRVGIVGMGKMGKLRASYMQGDDRLTLVAACDSNPANLEDLPSQVSKFNDWRELIHSDLDIVYACAYNWLLPEIVIAAIQAGKHVFSEKPPGKNKADVERIIEAAKAKPELCIHYGFNHRKHYSVMQAKELIDSGEFGKILWLRGAYGKCGGEGFEKAWRNQGEKSGGGILLDQGIHMLDLFHFFGFQPTEIKSFASTSYWPINTEDNAFALLSDGRATAMIHSSATQWEHLFRLEIGLERGFINLTGLNTGSRSYGEETLEWGKPQMDNHGALSGRPAKNVRKFNKDDSWALEQDDFLKDILENPTHSNRDLQNCLQVMNVIEKIYAQNLC